MDVNTETENKSYYTEDLGRGNFIRYGLGLPIAGGVTLGLCLLMANLIATEFRPQEKLAVLNFAINPVQEDIETSLERTKPEPLKEVDIPPAPPTVATSKVIKIVPGPVVDPEAKNIFKPVVFDIKRAALIQANRNPDPLILLPPAMPSGATRSGHCDVRLNVDAAGAPYKVEATYCTQSVFERPTIKAVAKWKYRPRIVDGRAVAMEGLTNRVSFHLTDARGNLIPE